MPYHLDIGYRVFPVILKVSGTRIGPLSATKIAYREKTTPTNQVFSALSVRLTTSYQIVSRSQARHRHHGT
jgi:hypothetical protein